MDYDKIGKTYINTRRAEPRITNRLIEALGCPIGSHLIDIGAGTGNYSAAVVDKGYTVTAVEPSQVMHDQGRQRENLHWVKASGEDIPFPDSEFDGAIMTLCLHHLHDWKKTLFEVMRVTAGGPLVIFAFDIEQKADFWLFDYFPTLAVIDQQWPPSMSTLQKHIQDSGLEIKIDPFELPNDLVDHFLAAGWATPKIYLDENYRNGISSFSNIQPAELETGLALLEKELSDGTWESKFGKLLTEQFHDRGYKFVKIYQL